MTATCPVFVATSLDGCLVREDGRIDWLERANTVVPPGEDCGYREVFDPVDALVTGAARSSSRSRSVPGPAAAGASS